MEAVFFLKSKRFWAMVFSPVVSWAFTTFALVEQGILDAAQQEMVIGILAAVFAGVFGMVWGKRAVTVVPQKVGSNA